MSHTTALAYASAETAAAQQQLCDTYVLVTRAIEVDTTGNDRALAWIADTIGGVLLDVAGDKPAFDTNHSNVARLLAPAYCKVTAKGNSVVGSEGAYRAAPDDVIAKDGALKKVCRGG
ncbi:hypothetical protein QRB36_15055 [Mycobacterium marseillense]|uniref:hypothetical protein n=1 Tax=Mycobacterium marseillense TaxID=701042 RepID=UPI002596D6F6|nr:hypothetical protein [Mycobacterium marseillense]MDM3975485.1 hypothetical protein [Mycobacterium marseillense]